MYDSFFFQIELKECKTCQSDASLNFFTSIKAPTPAPMPKPPMLLDIPGIPKCKENELTDQFETNKPLPVSIETDELSLRPPFQSLDLYSRPPQFQQDQSSLRPQFQADHLYSRPQFQTGHLYSRPQFQAGHLYSTPQFQTDHLYSRPQFQTGHLHSRPQFQTHSSNSMNQEELQMTDQIPINRPQQYYSKPDHKGQYHVFVEGREGFTTHAKGEESVKPRPYSAVENLVPKYTSPLLQPQSVTLPQLLPPQLTSSISHHKCKELIPDLTLPLSRPPPDTEDLSCSQDKSQGSSEEDGSNSSEEIIKENSEMISSINNAEDEKDNSYSTLQSNNLLKPNFGFGCSNSLHPGKCACKQKCAGVWKATRPEIY